MEPSASIKRWEILAASNLELSFKQLHNVSVDRNLCGTFPFQNGPARRCFNPIAFELCNMLIRRSKETGFLEIERDIASVGFFGQFRETHGEPTNLQCQ
jgi:hypothetical protein